jgi:hypothetical protein
MNKKDLLELDAYAHLSISELRKQKPQLAEPLDDRLDTRAHSTVVAQLAGKSEKLRKLVESVRIPVRKEPGTVKLREAAIKAVRAAVKADPRLASDTELAKEIEDLAKGSDDKPVPGVKRDATLADSLRLNEPIAFHPEFRKEIEAASCST